MAIVAKIPCILLLVVSVQCFDLPPALFLFDVGDKIVAVSDEGSSPAIRIANGFSFFNVVRTVAFVSLE